MSIQRRGKMVGNPHYTLTSEGYSKAINGALPDEIQEALKTTGIVVLENEETESMMFLVAEELKETESGVLKEEDKLQPVILPDGTPNLFRFIPQNPDPTGDHSQGYYYEKPTKEYPFGRWLEMEGP